jgi:integrase
MIIDAFPDLITAYLAHLEGRASHSKMVSVASQWIGQQSKTPTRAQILARQQAICAGHYAANTTKANKELALIRAACRWGIYQERWSGGDPTVGIRKWKTSKRRRTGKREELGKLLGYFERAQTETELRDRALYGLMLFTGCRPSEARTAKVEAITAYGAMGSWLKGRTKTGETQELPLPTQLMPWLAAWLTIRPVQPNPFLFPGQAFGASLTTDNVRLRWHELRLILGISGLWNYDLRRTLACTMGNELHEDDHTIRAILNHHDGSALGHYSFKSFDALTGPIQAYADWLWMLPASTEGRQDSVRVSARPIVSIPPTPCPTRPLTTPPVAAEEEEMAPPTLLPVIAPPVVASGIPLPIPFTHTSRFIEREEWPG